MTTECNGKLFQFHAFGRREVQLISTAGDQEAVGPVCGPDEPGVSAE
jgi:hypothetical protein